MARFYGVTTGDHKEGVRRRSITSDRFMKAEIAIEIAPGVNKTYRLEITDDEVVLLCMDKRWDAAQATPESEWTLLWEN